MVICDSHLGDERASAFSENDEDTLAQLAPLAKAYGFILYTGPVERNLSCLHKIDHEYKDYEEWVDRLDISKLEMNGDIGDLLWEFRNLDGTNALSVTSETVSSEKAVSVEVCLGGLELDEEDWEGEDDEVRVPNTFSASM